MSDVDNLEFDLPKFYPEKVNSGGHPPPEEKFPKFSVALYFSEVQIGYFIKCFKVFKFLV